MESAQLLIFKFEYFITVWAILSNAGLNPSRLIGPLLPLLITNHSPCVDAVNTKRLQNWDVGSENHHEIRRNPQKHHVVRLNPRTHEKNHPYQQHNSIQPRINETKRIDEINRVSVHLQPKVIVKTNRTKVFQWRILLEDSQRKMQGNVVIGRKLLLVQVIHRKSPIEKHHLTHLSD